MSTQQIPFGLFIMWLHIVCIQEKSMFHLFSMRQNNNYLILLFILCLFIYLLQSMD